MNKLNSDEWVYKPYKFKTGELVVFKSDPDKRGVIQSVRRPLTDPVIDRYTVSGHPGLHHEDTLIPAPKPEAKQEYKDKWDQLASEP